MLRIKRLCLAASLLLVLFAPPVVAETTKQECFTGAATIPSKDSNGVTTSISVSDVATGTISSVKLTGINVIHGFIGEISAYLIHGGKTVIIGDDPGVDAVTSPQGCKGKNITNLTISDATGTNTGSIENNCTMTDPAYDPAFTYRPSQPLSGFNGYDVNGVWSLKLVDNYDNDFVDGILNGWCLEYSRPTASITTITPAEGLIDFGAAYYPTGVTQDIVIQANSGDNFQISRVEFLSVSAGATDDFIGTIKKELPSASAATLLR